MKGRAARPARGSPSMAMGTRAPRPPQHLRPPSITVAWRPLSLSEGGWVCWHFGLGCKRSHLPSPSRTMARAVALPAENVLTSVAGVWFHIPQHISWPRPSAVTHCHRHQHPAVTPSLAMLLNHLEGTKFLPFYFPA